MTIYSNDPERIIRLGNNQDTCYICKQEVIEAAAKEGLNLTDRWNEIKKLEGKEEYKPMVKIRYNGNDICICEDHLNKIYKEMEEISKKMNPEEGKKDVKKTSKKADKKEDKENEKK